MGTIDNALRLNAGGPWSLGAGSGASKPGAGSQPPVPPASSGGAIPGSATNQSAQIQLTRHEKRSFVAQTVHLAGNAFVDCSFDSCTLVITNSPFVFSGQCRVQRCNWRVEYDLLWGAPAMRVQLRQILDSMDATVDPSPAV
ncbi:MAG: hypothetical protein EXS01_06445 [Phycisphaerales bacterium]|nr:hypothetical protein [Phycisphaerales bacterium]